MHPALVCSSNAGLTWLSLGARRFGWPGALKSHGEPAGRALGISCGHFGLTLLASTHVPRVGMPTSNETSTTFPSNQATRRDEETE